MNQEKLKALISLLEDDDREVLNHVQGRLASLGQQVIPALQEFREQNPGTKLQQRLESLIQHMQYNSVAGSLEQWVANEQDDLLKAMWIIATYQNPALQYQQLKQQVQQLYYDVWLEFKHDLHPFDQIKILNSIFFSRMKFSANIKDFHAPENSMINHVINSRRGNPISLCIIYMLIARQLKLPVYGVNLPNLFILTYKNEQIQFYINAFNKGLIFSRTDIDNYVAQLQLQRQPTFYEPCGNTDIVKRVVRNLMVSFEKQSDDRKKEDMQTLINILGN